MNKKKVFYICYIIVVCLFGVASCAPYRADAVLHEESSAYAIAYGDDLIDIDISSAQCFVYDVHENKLIFTKGEKKVIYPGSTSKLITALYALSVLSPDEIVTAGSELDFVKPDSSIAYIKNGHKLSVKMLIEGMLIPSGNDAAYVLAAAIGRKLKGNDITSEEAIEAFILGINDYAAKNGLCGTKITVPDGYAGSEQYTTTEDMAIIAKLAYENEIISEYSSMLSDSVIYASGQTNTWINTNKLLDDKSIYYSRYASGMKTGSINGEYSLIFTFEYDDGREYIAGIFGSSDKNTRFKDALKIINFLEIC